MDKKTEVILQVLATQRNQALDTVAMLNGRVSELEEELNKLKSNNEPE